MAATASHNTKISAEEFDVFVFEPENRDFNFELIAGEIVKMVSNPDSSKIAAKLTTLLGMYLLQYPIGELTGADGGYEVGDDRYIPDVAFARVDKMLGASVREGYLPFAPDLAVEVLSPSNSDKQMRIKVANYLAAGTVVWVVDIDARTVEIYAPGHRARTLTDNDMVTGGEVLPGFEIKVEEIWPRSLSIT